SLGAQAWMTGTGKELFEAFGDRAKFLEVNEASSGSFLK
ncbi:DNA replication and repair protein RecF, partial [Amylibacter sp.]|nr:DNA replication and repair protein RecF [Amylibacter sp.]